MKKKYQELVGALERLATYATTGTLLVAALMLAWRPVEELSRHAADLGGAWSPGGRLVGTAERSAPAAPAAPGNALAAPGGRAADEPPRI